MAGAITSAVKNLFSREEKCKILMVGLDAAGKTTILDKLKLDGNVNEIVTKSCAMGKLGMQTGAKHCGDVYGGTFVYRVYCEERRE